MQLKFYDHHRQNYAGNVPCQEAGEFMVGDYGSNVNEGGEFAIVLHDFRRQSSSDKGYSPQLRVFSDAHGSFMQAVNLGLLSVLRGTIQTRDDLSRALIAIGIEDVSDVPLAP